MRRQETLPFTWNSMTTLRKNVFEIYILYLIITLDNYRHSSFFHPFSHFFLSPAFSKFFFFVLVFVFLHQLFVYLPLAPLLSCNRTHYFSFLCIFIFLLFLLLFLFIQVPVLPTLEVLLKVGYVSRPTVDYLSPFSVFVSMRPDALAIASVTTTCFP